VQPGQELLQKWEARADHLYPGMEITGEGLMLGAGTILAKMARDGRSAQRLTLDNEPRAMALLATAYEQPVEPYIFAKLRRACELWNADEKALAHIHLAHANLPPCDEERALRLFVADELLEVVTPAGLMKAQGFDPAPLDLLKAHFFNPDQPRVPAGNGRESGEWSGGASIDSAGVKEWIARLLLEAARRAARSLRPSETKPPNPEVVKPESTPPETPETENLQPPVADANKLRHIFDNPRHELDGLVTEFGSQEAAFEAIRTATQEAIKRQNISGMYGIEIEVRGHKLTVRGTVMNDGTIKIGTVFP
jgi:hypothetical protein